ncbi:MAG: HEAT repeat domain-containing protein [Aggregatilineales bacterium]
MEDAAQCLHCGFNLREAAQRSYEERLIAALRHRVPEYRVTAAQILGRRGCAAALPEFRRILETEQDLYLIKTVLRALKDIKEPLSVELIQSATRHPSRLVANLAASLLMQMAAARFCATEWDTAAAR